MGSVAAGGRYDNLVGMFSGKTQIPCVGISFGVDRIFSIPKARMAANKSADQVRKNEVDVYVMSFGGQGFLKERMSVCSQLWEGGIKASYEALSSLRFRFFFSSLFVSVFSPSILTIGPD